MTRKRTRRATSLTSRGAPEWEEGSRESASQRSSVIEKSRRGSEGSVSQGALAPRRATNTRPARQALKKVASIGANSSKNAQVRSLGWSPEGGPALLKMLEWSRR